MNKHINIVVPHQTIHENLYYDQHYHQSYYFRVCLLLHKMAAKLYYYADSLILAICHATNLKCSYLTEIRGVYGCQYATAILS